MTSIATKIPAELTRQVNAAIAQYPPERKRSAALPLLHLWQEHFGFISDEGIHWISGKLELQLINILELVTFYPMLRQNARPKPIFAFVGHLVVRWLAATVLWKIFVRPLALGTDTTVLTIQLSLARMGKLVSNSWNVWPAAALPQSAWSTMNYTKTSILIQWPVFFSIKDLSRRSRAKADQTSPIKPYLILSNTGLFSKTSAVRIGRPTSIVTWMTAATNS